jgi:hypothetical protein
MPKCDNCGDSVIVDWYKTDKWKIICKKCKNEISRGIYKTENDKIDKTNVKSSSKSMNFKNLKK